MIGHNQLVVSQGKKKHGAELHADMNPVPTACSIQAQRSESPDLLDLLDPGRRPEIVESGKEHVAN